ncbi:hypothetical protein IFM89_023050 [Coptis chinensis]|uniref:Peroxidase n=1 Tax=Coptis chinensis TaxID=261450 RepID=A0A835IX69_9MAGN|nr:hypothetical protein IFM89_023050 [Coptis chinensis]
MALSMHSTLSISLVMIFITIFSSPASAQLSVSFYGTTCPSVFDTVRAATRSAINREARMGASILRLFFHDCFVNGCDGGVLLAGGERTALANNNSIIGFGVIDNIKAQVDRACGRSVVSCADILAISARDSVVEMGGQSYSVPLGRRDARTASLAAADSDLPAPFDNVDQLIRKFDGKRDRIYRQVNIDPAFATSIQANCPRTGPAGDDNLAPLDPQSPLRFGNNYFQALMNRRGLLISDQTLFSNGPADSFVRLYADDANAFATDFTTGMIKMGNLSPLTGTQGEIRTTCQRAN